MSSCGLDYILDEDEEMGALAVEFEKKFGGKFYHDFCCFRLAYEPGDSDEGLFCRPMEYTKEKFKKLLESPNGGELILETWDTVEMKPDVLY